MAKENQRRDFWIVLTFIGRDRQHLELIEELVIYVYVFDGPSSRCNAQLVILEELAEVVTADEFKRAAHRPVSPRLGAGSFADSC